MPYARLLLCVAVALLARCAASEDREPGGDPGPTPMPMPEPGALELRTVTPASATRGGGARIVLLGSGFLPGATVTIGEVAALSVEVVSASELRAIVPRNLTALGPVSVVVKNAGGAQITRADLFSYTRGRYALDAPVRAPLLTGQRVRRFVDLDGDKVPDVIADSSYAMGLHIYMQRDGHFTPGGFAALPMTGGIQEILDADLDGDGKRDLVILENANLRILTLLGGGDGTLGAYNTQSIPVTLGALQSADVDGDNREDLLGLDLANRRVVVLRSGAGGVLGAPAFYATYEVPQVLQTADLNGDKRPDLIAGCPSKDMVNIIMNRGDGTFAPGQLHAVTSLPYLSRVADFDGDGKVDLAVPGATSNDVAVLRGNGDGTFQAKRVYPVGQGPYKLEVWDLTGDGKLDLISLNMMGGDVSLLPGNGDGTFAAARAISLGGTNSAQSIDAKDAAAN